MIVTTTYEDYTTRWFIYRYYQ